MIKTSIKEAMKEKDTVRLEVLRSIQAAFTNELVATRRTPHDTLADDEAQTVIARLAKQRKDSIEQYTNGGRDDLAQAESAELEILETFLPEMMNLEEIHFVATKKKEDLNIHDKSKMGILIGALMKELRGKADGADVKKVVESLF